MICVLISVRMHIECRKFVGNTLFLVFVEAQFDKSDFFISSEMYFQFICSIIFNRNQWLDVLQYYC